MSATSRAHLRQPAARPTSEWWQVAGEETVERLLVAGLRALHQAERRLGIDRSRRGGRFNSTRRFVGHISVPGGWILLRIPARPV